MITSRIFKFCFTLVIVSLLPLLGALRAPRAATAQQEQTTPSPITPTETLSVTATLTPTVPTATPTILTPTPHIISKNLYEITLEKLGYSDQIMRGPLAHTRYYFSIPANWKLQTHSHLLLDLDYNVSGLGGQAPAFLQVLLNNEVLHTEDLQAPGFYQIRIDLPREFFHSFEHTSINTLGVSLQVSADCEQAQLSSLTLHDSSTLRFSRLEKPLPLDLGLYPKPFYLPGSFDPNQVRFILPAQPNQADIETAAMIASHLGNLTGSSLRVSATLASELPAVGDNWNENLIVIGRPDDNPILSELNLPLPLAQRRLEITSEMPTFVAPGDTFEYTLYVKNDQGHSQNLFVQDQIPPHTTLLSCSNECSQPQPGLLLWEIDNLPTEETVSNTVKLVLAGHTLLNEAVEHTATLFDSNNTPLNADTLAATSALTASQQTITSPLPSSNYFFLKQGQAIAENDGVLQELASPWNPQRAILVVSGLNQHALYKATQALSSKNRFPQMSGEYALVRKVLPPAAQESQTANENVPFSSLDYSDGVLKGTSYNLLEYKFDLPWGSLLTEQAFVALHIAHGGVFNDQGPTLEIKLNNIPISSIPLIKEDTGDAWISIPIPANPLRTGPNTLRLQMALDIDWCVDERNQRSWLTVYADSFFHLPRKEQASQLDLERFPYPFSNQPGLKDLLYVLPAQPTSTEVQGLLRLTTLLGRAAGGDDFNPRVVLHNNSSSEQWSGYQLVVIGKPTTNPYLERINDALPQPFYPGSNQFLQNTNRAIYRLEPNADLGFVQELLAPWDAEQVILVITGSTDTGVAWALEAITNDDLVWQLYGNLALVRDTQIQSADTSESTQGVTNKLVATLFPEMTPQPTPTPTPTAVPATPTPTPTPTVVAPRAVPSTSTAPFWLLPLFLLSILAVAAMAGVAVWRSRV